MKKKVIILFLILLLAVSLGVNSSFAQSISYEPEVNNQVDLQESTVNSIQSYSSAEAENNFERESYEALETKSYHVDANVNRNKSVNITETISVKFNESSHGIVRIIPLDNITPEYKLKRLRISKVKVADVKSSVNYLTINGIKVVEIRMGDKDVYLSGDTTYKFSYTLSTELDDIDEYDIFNMNIFPNEWETVIDKATFSIKFPTTIDSSKIEFYVGNGVSSDINLVYNNNEVIGQLNEPLGTLMGVSIVAKFEDKYFKEDLLTLISFYLGIIVTAIAVIITFISWLLFGRDTKPTPTIEFHAPTGMTPADVGYVLNGKTCHYDLLSLIIYWANAGNISIVEDKVDNNNVTLKMLKVLPPTAKNYERTMFNGLFKSVDSVKISSLSGSFYATLELSKKQFLNNYKEPDKRLYTKKSLIAEKFGVGLSILSIAIAIYNVLYAFLLNILISVAISVILGALLGIIIFGIYERASGIKQKEQQTVKFFFILPLSLVLLTGVIFVISLFNVKTLVLLVISYILSGIAMTFGYLSKQRTQESTKLLGKILGFKDFIAHTEKSRIETLCKENPSYFYDILPYAYVLGITDVWSEKFEGLTIPPASWYMSGNISTFSSVIFISSLNSSMRTIKNGAVPPKSHFTGRSGGGFGGGGGFSGGSGFGGGGGGRW